MEPAGKTAFDPLLPVSTGRSRPQADHSAWRYIDLSEYAEYPAQMNQETLVVEMREEAKTLKAHHDARESIKEIIEGPNESIDRISRSIKMNRGLVSVKLRLNFRFSGILSWRPE